MRSPLLRDERTSPLWIVGRTLEKLRVPLFFPEIEVVTIDVVPVDLILLVVFSPFCLREIDGHLDVLVLTEELSGEGVDSFLVDDRPHAVFKERLSSVSAFVGRCQSETVRRERHLGNLEVRLGCQMVGFVGDEQAEPVAVLVDIPVGAVVGRDCERADVVTPATEDADLVRELLAERVGERGVPLVHQVDGRGNDECADAGVGDGLQSEERLPAAGREDDRPLPVVRTPRVECGLLILTRFDLECGCQCEVRVRSGSVFDIVTESAVEGGLATAIVPLSGPLEECPVPIRLGPIRIDAVVPLCVWNFRRRIVEQERPLVEFDPHSVPKRTTVGRFNLSSTD
jgi:hypothetical protein